MNVAGARILVVDDDRAVRAALKVNLEKERFDVVLASSAEEALGVLENHTFDLLLTDVRMGGRGGLELLEETRRRWPTIECLVMTGYGNVDDAVAAMKAGAADYIIKPVSKSELLVIIERTLDSRDLRAEVAALRREMESHFGFANIVGTSQAMQKVYELARSVADTSALVLLQGETGTGKELVARAIHGLSSRKEGPFVRVNCAALPDTLLESELFGHDKGAFTGAIKSQAGRFEQAHRGTILLDEIGEISLAMQVKLLHVLEDGSFQRIGGQETIKPDVRIMAATNRDLHQDVQEGRFRKDLFYRLNVFTIRLPPLRERMEDVPALVDHFLQRFGKREDRPPSQLASAAMQQILVHDWPGNVRELEHALERAMILAGADKEIAAVDIEPGRSPDLGPATPDPIPDDLPGALREYERRLVLQALGRCGGVQARAARNLGISRSNLHYRLKKLGIEPPT